MTDEFTTNEHGKNVLDSIFSGKRVCVHYPAIINGRFKSTAQLLRRLLNELDIGFLSDLIFILLKEITSNCSKANAKRIYFAGKNLNIAVPEEYSIGMQNYTKDVLGDWQSFVAQNNSEEFYINIYFYLTETFLVIEVENNVEIIPEEWKRLRSRIEYFNQFRDLENSVNAIHDESEGAGLGIVLIKVLLLNAGIDPDNFNILSKNGVTRSSLKIPLSLTPDEKQIEIKEQIIGAIEQLPSFPETITEIIALCNVPDVSLDRVAHSIQKDPGLVAQVLKLANSAGYMNRFESISLLDAVKIIGLKMVKNILYAIGTKNILASKVQYREFAQIWNRSNRVAYYTRQIANKLKPEVMDLAFIAGLIHELGKIVLLSLGSKNITLIEKLIGSGRIYNTTILEEIAIGISHSEIGALLGIKWKFPDSLIVAIRYQQKPLHSPDRYRDIVYALHLAIQMCESKEDDYGYHYLDENILAHFGFNTITDYIAFIEKLKATYSPEMTI